jgi:hypothetical protein
MDNDKSVDESWKERAETEKDRIVGKGHEGCSCHGDHDHAHVEDEEGEFNFLTYVTSLAFQAMIFLGLIPNPMAGDKIEKNLRQAKFLIDTLVVLRDKTKGNLTKQEEELLGSSIYELQLRYVSAVEEEKRPAA